VHYPGYFDPDQLYDLRADPYEQRNLAGEPAHEEIRAALGRKLPIPASESCHRAWRK
jgi:hypothetical protein